MKIISRQVEIRQKRKNNVHRLIIQLIEDANFGDIDISRGETAFTLSVVIHIAHLVAFTQLNVCAVVTIVSTFVLRLILNDVGLTL